MDEIQNNGTSVNKAVSTSETGHAKNVANFEKLIAYINGFGAIYNPVNNALKVENLQTLYNQSDADVKQVNHLVPPWSVAVGERKMEFDPLNKYVTRLTNAAKAIGIADEVVANIMTVKRKLEGRGSSESGTSAIPDSESIENKKISTSQQSYDSKLNNFNKMLEILSNLPEYVPNEAELQIDVANTYYERLHTKNRGVLNTAVPLVNARIARDKTLYTDNTGLCDIAMDAKNYIKSLFGADSPEFKAVNKISFKKYK